MKIICPKCGADYNINDSKIPADGLHIKCPKCLHSFVATKDGAASLGATSGAMRAVSAVSRGFWTSLRELDIHEAWVISPVDEGYPLGDGAEVLPLSEAIARLG